MNSDFSWTLEQVADSIQYNAIKLHAATSFLRPHDGIWPQEPKQFVGIAREIMSTLTSGQKRVFLSVCLVSFLFNPVKAPLQFKEWFKENAAPIDLLGIEISLDQLASCQWGRIAIPLADPSGRDRKLIAYTAVGVSRTFTTALFPHWIDSSLNGEAQETVKICVNLVTNRYPTCNFLFWPMTNLETSSCLINGTSLGLPVYLTLFSLANNCSVPNILATGTLDSTGTLQQVAFIDEKFKLAEHRQFNLFIYPHFSGIKPLQATGKTEPVGVATLLQAERVWGSQSHDQNFIAYLEKVKNNFRTRIGRFVHLEGQEEITLLNSYAVELIPDLNDEYDEIIARRGTIEDLRYRQVAEQRMMLWGDAGMGKSTTLEYFAYKDADRKLKEPDAPLPVYLPLGLLTDGNLTLKQIIWKRIGVDEAEGEVMLVDGNINLFLDGVNEIPKDMNSALINTRIREIQNLIDEYRNTFIMVSNRQQTENIFHNIPVFIMQKMDESQIEVFIQRNAGNPVLVSMILDELCHKTI